MVAVAVPAHLFAFLRIRRDAAEILEVLPVYMLPIGAFLFLANLIAQICNALGVGLASDLRRLPLWPDPVSRVCRHPVRPYALRKARRFVTAPSGKKMIIAQITDTHLLPEGRKLADLIDTNAQLEAAVSRLNRLSTPADVVLVTGDLVDDGGAGVLRGAARAARCAGFTLLSDPRQPRPSPGAGRGLSRSRVPAADGLSAIRDRGPRRAPDRARYAGRRGRTAARSARSGWPGWMRRSPPSRIGRR